WVCPWSSGAGDGGAGVGPSPDSPPGGLAQEALRKTARAVTDRVRAMRLGSASVWELDMPHNLAARLVVRPGRCGHPCSVGLSRTWNLRERPLSAPRADPWVRPGCSFTVVPVPWPKS